MPLTIEKLALVQERIRVNAAKYFPHLAGREISVRCRRFPGGSNPLYCCELQPNNGPTPSAQIIVKFAPKPLLIEFDYLTLLYETRSEIASGLVVLRPLDFFPDVNALLTEKIGGEPLLRLVLRKLHRFAGHTERESIAARIRLCGQWLANFHRLTHGPNDAPFDEAWIDDVSGRIRDLERIGFSPLALRTARTILSSLHRFGHSRPAPYAPKHGDFGLWNVQAGDDWVCVFDLNDRRSVCIYDDLAFFVVTLEIINTWPRYPLFDRRAAVAMKGHLLEGYFGSNKRYSDVLMEGHMLKQFLFRCVRQRGDVAARSPMLLPLFDAVYLPFYSQRVLRQCERIDRFLSDEVNRASVVRHA